jgi:hypothetical protein
MMVDTISPNIRSIRLSMNEFMDWGHILITIIRTNKFGPCLISHQNTRTPNGTHDFNQGNYNTIRHHPATHDFSRGTINPNRKSPSTYEFMRGKKEVIC